MADSVIDYYMAFLTSTTITPVKVDVATPTLAVSISKDIPSATPSVIPAVQQQQQ